MKLFVYAVHDVKAGTFMTPFFMQSNGAAIRSFFDAVKDTNHPISKHPEDYTLFHVGTWDDDSGQLVGIVPEAMVKALDAL